MKRIFTLITAIALSPALWAATHTISISGNSYNPANITAQIGDNVVIEASQAHPLVQVDLATWNNNGTTPVGGGWGVKTATYEFTITQMGDIHFICQTHASMGMKGKVAVFSPTQIPELTLGASISLFPNPAENGTFNVVTLDNAPDGLNLLLFNTLGQTAEKHTLAAGVNSLATTLPAGAYFYAITNKNQAILRTGKLFVTR